MGLVAGAQALAACGANAAGICDFGECTAQQITLPLDGSAGDGTTGEEGSVGGEGSTGDANPSCGDDANVAYCGQGAGCVDTTSSPGNCGTCGNACAVPANGAATCTGGTCGVTCAEGFVQCNGACDPLSGEPAVNPCTVTSANGIFVAPPPAGNDSAAGTETAPVATITQGVELAKTAGLAVFVCDATYTAPLTFTAAVDGVNVYGGLVCPGAGVTNAWAYEAGGQVTVAPTTAGTTALAISGLTTGMTFEDFVFQSSNASGVDSDGNGASSLAATVSWLTGVVFKRVAMVAGTGAAGNPGTAQEEGDGGTQAGPGGVRRVSRRRRPSLGWDASPLV